MSFHAQFPPGLWPVMLTPFQADGCIDWSALDYLIEWYVYSGAHGLFAVCYSSEMFMLAESERLEVAKRTVQRAGRTPVIAAGTFGDTIDLIASYVNRLADTGVAAVVCITNQFCAEGDDDNAWKRGAERLLRLLDPALALGLYECPLPYPRLMTPELLRWANDTGRFLFLKDTSCSMAKINPKIDVLRHSRIKFFNANAVTLLDSLRAGGHGFSGIAANFCPQLYAWMCAEHRVEPELADRLQWFMSATDLLLHHKYPASAKRFLAECGVPLSVTCRVSSPVFAEADVAMLEALRMQIIAWHRELKLRPFLPSAVRVQ